MTHTFLNDPMGDVRAESDTLMLDNAFYEWTDYKSLLSDSNRYVIVGRRGTGKSALVYKLAQRWREEKRNCLEIKPNEEELIGFKEVATLFGADFTNIRAGVKILWKYALIMQAASAYSKDYKTNTVFNDKKTLLEHYKIWDKTQGNVFDKLRKIFYQKIKNIESIGMRVADLAESLSISKLYTDLNELIKLSNKSITILIDRLDEGLSSDTLSVGIINGIIYGTDDFRENTSKKIVCLIFLRDNIYRSVQSLDSDFSRNVEHLTLRLHWDPQELMHMATSRLQYSLNSTKEIGVKTWNNFTANELHGVNGFKKCLRHTLYRPRDVISLLNTSMLHAKRQARNILIEEDINYSAEEISKSRLEDLCKEYVSVFPGLDLIIKKFQNNITNLNHIKVNSIFKNVLLDRSLSNQGLQHIYILANSEFSDADALYSIGFLGYRDESSKTYVFCHDGRDPSKKISQNTEIIVHPCYWSALGKESISEDDKFTEEIFDEYEVSIFSKDSEDRNQVIGRIISELTSIQNGREDAGKFEKWCEKAIAHCFSYQLDNVKLHANPCAPQQRDVVATNKGKDGVWERIHKDYGTRQVIFEVKNFEELETAHYRQVNGYLEKEYGKLAFIICRSKTLEPSSTEAQAFRTFYKNDSKHFIIKLTSSWLVSALSKLRSPQKFDASDKALSKLLDDYIRIHANEQIVRRKKK